MTGRREKERVRERARLWSDKIAILRILSPKLELIDDCRRRHRRRRRFRPALRQIRESLSRIGSAFVNSREAFRGTYLRSIARHFGAADALLNFGKRPTSNRPYLCKRVFGDN